MRATAHVHKLGIANSVQYAKMSSMKIDVNIRISRVSHKILKKIAAKRRQSIKSAFAVITEQIFNEMNKGSESKTLTN